MLGVHLKVARNMNFTDFMCLSIAQIPFCCILGVVQWYTYKKLQYVTSNYKTWSLMVLDPVFRSLKHFLARFLMDLWSVVMDSGIKAQNW